MKHELFFNSLPVSLVTEDDKPRRIEGYAVKYNVLSHDRGGYVDVFRPGVFRDSIADPNHDIKVYFNHDWNHGYLARRNNGTLRLTDTPIGLQFSFDVPDTTVGRDVIAMMERPGDIEGMSFGYLPDEFSWKHEKQGGLPVREHTRGILDEISPVHDPGIPFTEAVLYSLQQWKHEQERRPLMERAKRILQLMS